ncbi:MAG: DUF697 domain-containing protein [Pirellulaceae bacterium]|jgi:hypothetical protein|nr:DUF697 domain-containing protein [Pirellulaceae bacterium]MDP7020204.1 DUF697 domain-containing protein [Pirellulaceae bacterium]
MKLTHLTNRLMLLVTLAFLGFLLVYIPPKILQQYDTARSLGDWAVYTYFALVGTGGLLLTGVSGWALFQLWSRSARKRRERMQRAKNPSELSKAERTQETDANLSAVNELRDDTTISGEVRGELRELTGRIESKRESRVFEIVAFGTISSGKSSVLNALIGESRFATDAKGGTTTTRAEVSWPSQDRVVLVDTPGLGEVDGADHIRQAAEAARDADLVLVVIDGPVRESEFALIDRLGEMEKRIVVCLNKADWLKPADQETLRGQIVAQLDQIVAAQDVVCIQAVGGVRTRVRVAADGSEFEETVENAPEISALAERMLRVVRREGDELLLANLLLQSRGLLEEAHRKVRESLDREAIRVIDKHMWLGGGAAAVSPLPLLDLAAGSAITVKMVMELARIYRQQIDSEAAVNLLAQLGKNLIAILGVSAATPAVAAGVATLLKSVPGAGTIAGGLLQGITQAVVMRWIGFVFMEYFRNEMRDQGESFTQLARRQWDRVTAVDELRRLVSTARQQLRDD